VGHGFHTLQTDHSELGGQNPLINHLHAIILPKNGAHGHSIAKFLYTETPVRRIGGKKRKKQETRTAFMLFPSFLPLLRAGASFLLVDYCVLARLQGAKKRTPWMSQRVRTDHMDPFSHGALNRTGGAPDWAR
jgi:hypothetical protein